MIRTTDGRPRGLPIALALVLALGACAEAHEPEPTPTEDGGPYNMIDPVPDPAAPAGPGAMQLQGGWTSSPSGSESVLVFGNGGPEAVLRMRCDGRRGLVIERVGVSSVGPAELMEISVGSEVARLAVNRPVGTGSIVRAVVPYNHPLMKQLATDKGSIRVALDEATAVTAPLNQETKQFVLTCGK